MMPLEDIALFANLPQEVLDSFRQQGMIRRVPKGTVMYIQGDAADCFYVIQHGWVKLFRETLEGSEAIIDVMTTGHIFGENTVFEDGCYSYSVEVVEDALLLAMPVALLKEMIETDRQLALNMLSSMSRYRLQQHREIEHFNVQNAPQRIGCFLLRLCKSDADGSVTLHLPYDKTLIAGRLGMKPETFSRALAKLRDATGIRIMGPTVHIDNLATLVTYTCSHCSSSFPCDDLNG
jgi:CRP-like cAMP-binding protein